MSTRSNIGLIHLDGSVEVIYCHFDGYPEHNGAILLVNYNNADLAMRLVGKGNVSFIGSAFDKCRFYNDSNDSPNQLYISLDTYGNFISSDIFIEFCYLFDLKNNKWIWSAGNNKFKDLEIEDCKKQRG